MPHLTSPVYPCALHDCLLSARFLQVAGGGNCYSASFGKWLSCRKGALFCQGNLLDSWACVLFKVFDGRLMNFGAVPYFSRERPMMASSPLNPHELCSLLERTPPIPDGKPYTTLLRTEMGRKRRPLNRRFAWPHLGCAKTTVQSMYI